MNRFFFDVFSQRLKECCDVKVIVELNFFCSFSTYGLYLKNPNTSVVTLCFENNVSSFFRLNALKILPVLVARLDGTKPVSQSTHSIICFMRHNKRQFLRFHFHCLITVDNWCFLNVFGTFHSITMIVNKLNFLK